MRLHLCDCSPSPRAVPPSYQSKGSTKGEWLKLRMSTVAEGKIVPLALEKFNRELLGKCV